MEVKLFKNVIITYSVLILQLSFGFGNALSQFDQECMDSHNYYRRLCNVPPLKWSAKLAEIASKYAKKLSDSGTFCHSGMKGMGENLYSAGSSKKDWTIHGSDAVKAWYAEKKDYPCYYCEPSSKSKSGTGHYTQVVWKGTTDVGCGLAMKCSKTGTHGIVVCNYSGAGNVMNQYAQNVMPPKK